MVEKALKLARPKKPIPAFKREPDEGWQTATFEQAISISHALANPVRRTILELLRNQAIRQIDLARFVTQILKRRYNVPSIRHHLQVLKRVGLIAFKEFPGKGTKVKMVYRAADVEVRLRKRPEPEIVPPTRRPRTSKEWLLQFRRK
jgi:DNA-binding transcriptional ArsR family regulator